MEVLETIRRNLAIIYGEKMKFTLEQLQKLDSMEMLDAEQKLELERLQAIAVDTTSVTEIDEFGFIIIYGKYLVWANL